MKICIFGAGAIGGHLAARLGVAGHEVSVVARGGNLAAIQARGVSLQVREQVLNARVRASANPADLGPQDVVISTLKATGLQALAKGIGPLLGPDTAVVFAQNGIPWWYGQGLAPERPRPPDLSRMDPGGWLAKTVAAERVMGAVIMSSNTLVAPGVVHNDTPDANRLTVAECDDRHSERVLGLRAALESAGIASPATQDIRAMIWGKLVINMSGSSLCLLTGEDATIVARDPGMGEMFGRMVNECIAIAAAHGVALDVGQYASGRTSPPKHKPSILQDYEQSRPMEVDAIIRAPQAFARSAGIATPTLDVVAALAACRASLKGLYAH